MAEPFVTLAIAPLDAEAGGSELPLLRRNRRAHLAPEVLHSRKLAAGEWILLRGTGQQSAQAGHEDAQGWVVAQLWPRVGLDEDGE
jgi:hypothetical protein